MATPVICVLTDKSELVNDTSETFLFSSCANNPFPSSCITGIPFLIPVGVLLCKTVPTETLETLVVATNVTDFKSAEIALTRLNTGDALLVKLTIIISLTFSDPNVFPAHVNILDPSTLTSSPGPNSLIGDCLRTKSPLKSNANPEYTEES